MTGAYLDAAEALVAAAAGRRQQALAQINRFDVKRLDSYHAAMAMAEAAAFLGDAAAAARVLCAFERVQTCNQKHWLYRIAPGLSRLREAPEIRSWLGERGRRIVWPREAPALADEDRAQFTDYAEASGLPAARVFRRRFISHSVAPGASAPTRFVRAGRPFASRPASPWRATRNDLTPPLSSSWIARHACRYSRRDPFGVFGPAPLSRAALARSAASRVHEEDSP